MHTFHRKVVPIIVLLNFIISFWIISQLRFSLLFKEMENYDRAGLMIGLLLIIVINVIVIAAAKKRYGDKLSISGYIIFVIIILSASPVIMHGLVVLISKIFHMSGVGFSMV